MTWEIAQRAGVGLFVVSWTQVAFGSLFNGCFSGSFGVHLKRFAFVGQESLTSIFAAAADFPS
jgi:hypothetical protein